MRRQLSLSLVLAIVLAVYVSLQGSRELSLGPPPTRTDTEIAGTYVESLRRQRFGETGKLLDIMEARRLARYPDRAEADLTEPRYFTHDGNDRTWSMSAEHGLYREGANMLLLDTDVLLFNDQTAARFETSSLRINIKAKTARTEEPVRMTQGDNLTTADGMFANLVTELIALQPRVFTRYVPPSS
jgi:lipopolysaccharide export system protein LptC